MTEIMKMPQSNVSAIGSVSIGVMHRDGGFIFDESYYFDPEYRWKQDLKIAKWCEDKFNPYPIYNAEAHLVQLNHQPLPYRQVGGLQPNLILRASLGGTLDFPGNRDPDLASKPFSLTKGGATFSNIDPGNNSLIRKLLTQIEDLTHKYTDKSVDIFPPFFWDRSGRAAVHGPLTTAVALFGEAFFTLPFSDFKRAERIIQEITKSYLVLIKLFVRKTKLSFNEIHIGECSGTLFPPEIWEKLAVPAINILATAAGRVRLHSCGHSDHLFDRMLRIDNLSCLNIGSDSNVRLAREKFGPNIKIDIIPDNHLLINGDPTAIRGWIEKCIDDNADGPMEIQFHYDVGMPFSNIKRIFDTLDEYGVSFAYDSLVARWGS